MPMLRPPRSQSLVMPRLCYPRSQSLVMPRLCYPRSQSLVMPRFCHPRCHSQVMQGSVILTVTRIPHITAITLYCRLLYRTAMFVNKRWAYSSLMTTILKSLNRLLNSNNNQQ